MTDTVEAPVRRKPGPARTLTREQILQTGLDVMAADGLEAVSFRTIAERLGVDRKALYTYLRDRDELINGMFDAALALFALPSPDDTRPPEDQLIEMFVSMRRAYLANAGLFLMTRSSKSTSAVEPFGRIWSVITRLVPDERRAGELYIQMLHYTTGSALYAPQALEGTALDEALADAALTFPPQVLAFARAVSTVDLEASFVATLELLIRSATGTLGR